MRNVKRALAGVTASLALSAGIIGTTTGSAAATTGPVSGNANYWLCPVANLRDGNGANCLAGTGAVPTYSNLEHVGWAANDNISSIETNSHAINTWNNANFKGTYGYWGANYRWDSLSSPYDNAITSISAG